VYKKRTLYLIVVLLLIEAGLIVALHSRIPRPVRAITAGINVVAVAALLVMANQKR